MKTPATFRQITLFLCILLGCANMALADTELADTDNIRMLDFVIMSHGHGISDRNIYDDKMLRIAKKHNMTIERSFNIKKFVMGDELLAGVIRINVWHMPKGALKNLSEDADYQSLIEFRNSIHDMAALSIFYAEPDSIGGTAGHTILADLVVMAPDFDVNDRQQYENSVAPITQRYGMTRFASYDITKKLRGVAPEHAVRLNFWNLENPENMKLVGQDPDYKALVSYRNKIHDMAKVTLFFASENK